MIEIVHTVVATDIRGVRLEFVGVECDVSSYGRELIHTRMHAVRVKEIEMSRRGKEECDPMSAR
jgi:hypothetical protein